MGVNRVKTEGYSLRFPDGLRERIKSVAEANGRSLNAEIVATLEREYPNDDVSLDQALRVVEERIASGRDTPDPRLVRLRGRLLAMKWFEPVEEVE